MNIKLFAAATAGLMLTAAFTSDASSATVNFDTLPTGTAIPVGGSIQTETPISNQYASLGVTFVGIYDDGTTAAPVATIYAGGQEGPNYQRNYLGNSTTGEPFIVVPRFSIPEKFEILRLNFADGADDISFSHNNFALVTATTFNAYGQSGNLLETFTVNSGNGWTIRSLASDDVYRLDMIASTGALGYTFFGIDNLVFTPNAVAPVVPEPASWAMMIAGFGLVGGTMRRRATMVAAGA